MINRFGSKACAVCHHDIERGDEMTVVPGMSGPRGGKVYRHAQCTPVHMNPTARGKKSPFTKGVYGWMDDYEVTGPEGRRYQKKQLRKARRRGQAAHIAEEVMLGQRPPASKSPIQREQPMFSGELTDVVAILSGGQSPYTDGYYPTILGFYNSRDNAHRAMKIHIDRSKRAYPHDYDGQMAYVVGGRNFSYKMGTEEPKEIFAIVRGDGSGDGYGERRILGFATASTGKRRY